MVSIAAGHPEIILHPLDKLTQAGSSARIDIVRRNFGSDDVPRAADRSAAAHLHRILPPLPLDLPLELDLVPYVADPVDHESPIQVERVTEPGQVQEQPEEEESTEELDAVREEFEDREGDLGCHRRDLLAFRRHVVAEEVNDRY